MQLDTAKRYLLSRPRGGFNDTFVQLEKSALYAEKFGRVLILDMSGSGIGAQLDTLFDGSFDVGPELVVWDADIAQACDRADSVYPDFVKNRLSSYSVVVKFKPIRLVEKMSDKTLNFDHSCDHDAQLLVYDQFGGGCASFRALKRLRLRADVANEIVARLLPLGRGYDAVHIRHSDYKTQFRRFLVQLRPLLRKRRVLICSDSVAAKSAAQKILHRSTSVMSVADIPDIGRRALHQAKELDAYDRNLDLLCDLFGMALSDQLFFTQVTAKGSGRRLYSGFSLLAELLRRNKDVVRQLLANADQEAVEALFAPSPQVPGLYRRLQLWGQRQARRRMEKRTRKRFYWAERDQPLAPKSNGPL